MQTRLWRRKYDDDNRESVAYPPGALVPLELHQFPNPISASIGALTISKVGIAIEEHEPRDKLTGGAFAEYLTPRISQLFIDSIPHLLSVPFISVWPLHRPSQWGIRRFSLVHMEIVHYDEDETIQQPQQSTPVDDTQPHGDRSRIKSYRIQTLWPRMTLLEMVPPVNHMTNSSEMTVEITGGLLHSKAVPIIANLQLPREELNTPKHPPSAKAPETLKTDDTNTWRSYQLLTTWLRNSLTIIASGNERFVFDTQYLGRIRGAAHRRYKQDMFFSAFRNPTAKRSPATADDPGMGDVGVFQVCSRIEFPPTSLDFFVVGSGDDTSAETSLAALVKQPTSSTELKGRVQQILQEHEKDKDREGPSKVVVRTRDTSPEEIAKVHLEKRQRWPSRQSNGLVWMLWWQRQSQQLLIGILFRRFHKYLHDTLPRGYVAPLQSTE